jgi:hypothetical protein
MSSLLAGNREGSRTETARSSQSRAQGVHELRVPVYLTAALFVGVSLIDIVTLAWPLNPGVVAWRFGTLGAASNYILTTFFGVVLACWSASYFAHLRTLRVLAVLSIVAAVVLAVLLGDFVLSSLQLRNAVPQVEEAAFRIGTGKATVKYLFFSLAFLLTGIFSWRSARAYRRR